MKKQIHDKGLGRTSARKAFRHVDSTKVIRLEGTSAPAFWADTMFCVPSHEGHPVWLTFKVPLARVCDHKDLRLPMLPI